MLQSNEPVVVAEWLEILKDIHEKRGLDSKDVLFERVMDLYHLNQDFQHHLAIYESAEDTDDFSTESSPEPERVELNLTGRNFMRKHKMLESKSSLEPLRLEAILLERDNDNLLKGLSIDELFLLLDEGLVNLTYGSIVGGEVASLLVVRGNAANLTEYSRENDYWRKKLLA